MFNTGFVHDLCYSRLRVFSLSRGAIVLIALIFVLISLTGSFNYLLTNPAYRSDLSQDHAMSLALINGLNPYSDFTHLAKLFWQVDTKNGVNPHPSPHTLTPAFILLPFARMNGITVRIIWFVFSLLSLIVSMVIIINQTCNRISLKKFILVLSIIILLLPISLDLKYGQLNLQILLITTLAWWAAIKKKYFLTGLIMGLGIIFKLYGVPMLVVGLLVKNKNLLKGLLIFPLLYVLVASLILGFNNVSIYFTKIIPSVTDFWIICPSNLSISGLFLKLLKGSWYSLCDVNGLVRSKAELVVNPSFIKYGFEKKVSTFLNLAPFLLFSLMVYRYRKNITLEGFLIMSVVTSLLINPLVWEHTLIVLTIVTFACIRIIINSKKSLTNFLRIKLYLLTLALIVVQLSRQLSLFFLPVPSLYKGLAELGPYCIVSQPSYVMLVLSLVVFTGPVLFLIYGWKFFKIF